MIDQGRLLMEKGWTCFRLTCASHGATTVYEPRESIAVTARWLVAAREALGETVTLGVDYHHRLSVAEAASFCHKMPSGTLDFLEEPIRDETPDAYEALRRLVDVPFAIGEEFSSKWQFLPYIERGIHQFNRIDVCNVGGFTEAMKIAGWSEAHYVDLMPHNPLGPVCTAASVHMAAAVPNFSWLECRSTPTEALGFDDREFFPVQLELDGAEYVVPDGPGLGVEVDEARVAHAAFRFWEAPHLRRRDGSYTNW
jgi:galactonate dehydratase